jgi:hypothetical protein
MSKLLDLKDINFPDTPLDLASEEAVRKRIVKSSAYITYCIQSHDEDIEVNNNSKLAALTTSTHRNIQENLDPDEYLLRSIIEIEDAIEEINSLDNSYLDYKSELKRVKSKLEDFRPIDN